MADIETPEAATTPPMMALKRAIATHRNWFLLFGGLMILLGLIAIAFPLITTIATKIFIGWLLLIGGIAQILHAFGTQRWSEFFLNLLIAALFIILGGWLAFFPLTAVVTLTVLIALGFIIEGALEAVMAFRMRPFEGWLWMFFSGVVALLAGVLILAGLPGTAAWAIGLLVGLNLISTGWAYLFLALAAGRADQPTDATA